MSACHEPPYTAVIFTSSRTPEDRGYTETAARMEELAEEQPGYLGIESVFDAETRRGITVSYWRDADAAHAWKDVAEHAHAQHRGQTEWYSKYTIRIATVEREYSMYRTTREAE